MPKPRKFGRQIKKRLIIICEGKKTEPLYFKGLLYGINLQGKPIEICILDSKKNTAKELVLFAKSQREYRNDELWVVFDKDGYTKHQEAFTFAKIYNINIAFSSISFEYWILCHYIFLNRAFKNSYDIIAFLNEKHFIHYKKNDKYLFYKTRHHLKNAFANALRIRKYHTNTHPNKYIYELNPYTNVDELIEAIYNLTKIYS